MASSVNHESNHDNQSLFSKLISNPFFQIAVGGPTAFGTGCLAGRAVGRPILPMGGVMAIHTVAGIIIKKIIGAITKKYDLKSSTAHFITAAATVVLATAVAVTALALGILGPAGFGVYLAVGGTFGLLSVGIGLYLKFSGSDLPYSKAFKHVP